MIGVGKAKQYANVLDRPIGKGKQEVILSYCFTSLLPITVKLINLINFLKSIKAFIGEDRLIAS